jgi:Ca2+:H+ antiporter
MPVWTWVVPIAALALMLLATLLHLVGAVLGTLCAIALLGAVASAVHHAEVVAQRVGEPFGTVVLSIAVTVIEVALIVSIMVAGATAKPELARDTIFSVIMLTCNGIVGLAVLIGSLRHREQAFQVIGSNAMLATLIALTTLCMVLPSFTVSSPGPTYTSAQLLFAGSASLALWGTAVFVQTVRHREYFLPVGAGEDRADVKRPSARLALGSFGLLLAALTAVVGLAHVLSAPIEALVLRVGAPQTLISIAIATLTLMPEAWAALRAAARDHLQSSLNLALGSALASIGLTIPALALATTVLGLPLVLGLAPKELVLTVLTFGVTSITLVAGRTHLLLGAVHLVILGAFIFFALLP